MPCARTPPIAKGCGEVRLEQELMTRPPLAIPRRSTRRRAVRGPSRGRCPPEHSGASITVRRAGNACVTLMVDMKALAILTALAVTGCAVAQSVQNAGFELPVLGNGNWQYNPSGSGVAWTGPNDNQHRWGISSRSGAWGSSAHSGAQYGFIQTAGSIQQVVSGFEVGSSYQITFWMTNRNLGSPNTITVSIGGNALLTVTPPADGVWRQYTTPPFTASNTSYMLALSGPPNNGQDETSLIDDVAIADLTQDVWPMDRVDRWGGGKVTQGPDPSTLTTPWVFQKLSPGFPVSHAPAIDYQGAGYYGEWNSGNLVKFDTVTGATLGTFAAGSTIQSTPVLGFQRSLFFHAAPNLYALDPNALTSPWSFNTGATFVDNFNSASPVLGPDGEVVFPSTTGAVYKFDYLTGAIIWQQTVQPSDHSIAFSRDDLTVFVANGTRITALRYSDGSIAWSQDFGSATGTPAVAPNGTVVFGTAAGLVFDIDPASASTNWVIPTNGPVSASPAFNQNKVYAACQDGSIYALDQTSGNALWTFPTTGPIDIAPIVGSDGSVYTCNRVGDLYRIVGGVPIWHQTIPGGAEGSISMGSDGSLYVPNGVGNGLYIIRQQAIPFQNFASAQVVHGTTVSGSFSDVQVADSFNWILRNGITILASDEPVCIALSANLSRPDTAAFSIRLVASASYSTLDQIIQARNVSSGAWEVLDNRPATTTNSSILVTVNSNANRFIDQTTGQVQIRIGWRQHASLPSASWLGKIDQTRIEGIVPAFHP